MPRNTRSGSGTASRRCVNSAPTSTIRRLPKLRAVQDGRTLATKRTPWPAAPGRVVWQEGETDTDGTFGPWTIRWSVEEAIRQEPASSALNELADRMSIESQFRNARGEIVEASSETKRSLLAAMVNWPSSRLCWHTAATVRVTG